MLIFQRLLRRRCTVVQRGGRRRYSTLLVGDAKALVYRIGESSIYLRWVRKIELDSWVYLLKGLKDLKWRQQFHFNKVQLKIIT